VIAKLCARYRAECRFELDRRKAYSPEFVNIAEMLTANASSEAPNVCIQTHGRFGSAEGCDIERTFLNVFPALKDRDFFDKWLAFQPST
jgi:hypothetical protein